MRLSSLLLTQLWCDYKQKVVFITTDPTMVTIWLCLLLLTHDGDYRRLSSLLYDMVTIFEAGFDTIDLAM